MSGVDVNNGSAMAGEILHTMLLEIPYSKPAERMALRHAIVALRRELAARRLVVKWRSIDDYQDHNGAGDKTPICWQRINCANELDATLTEATP